MGINAAILERASEEFVSDSNQFQGSLSFLPLLRILLTSGARIVVSGMTTFYVQWRRQAQSERLSLAWSQTQCVSGQGEQDEENGCEGNGWADDLDFRLSNERENQEAN